MKIFTSLLVITLFLSFSIAHADIDSKLRVRENSQTVSIAGSTVLSDSKLHMMTAAGIISILYVTPGSTFATKTIIRLADGTKMALKKFATTMDFPNQSKLRNRYCSLTSPYSVQKAIFTITNTSNQDAIFTLASSTGAGVSPSNFTIPASSTSNITMGYAEISQTYSQCSADQSSGSVVPGGKAYYFVSQGGVQTDYVIFTMQQNSGSL